jgi:hypothetical protein
VRSQHHASAALYPWERPDTHLYRRLGGPQGQSGIRSPDCSACSESLYRLCYSAHCMYGTVCFSVLHLLLWEELDMFVQGGSNMTGTDFFLNHNCRTPTCSNRLQVTGSNPSRREGGGCGFTLSRSHSCCAVWLVYTQISPGHIWSTLYLNDRNNDFLNCKMSLILQVKIAVIFMFPNEPHSVESCFVVSSPVIQLLTLMLQTEQRFLHHLARGAIWHSCVTSYCWSFSTPALPETKSLFKKKNLVAL